MRMEQNKLKRNRVKEMYTLSKELIVTHYSRDVGEYFVLKWDLKSYHINNYQLINIINIVKYGGGSIMLWECALFKIIVHNIKWNP